MCGFFNIINRNCSIYYFLLLHLLLFNGITENVYGNTQFKTEIREIQEFQENSNENEYDEIKNVDYINENVSSLIENVQINQILSEKFKTSDKTNTSSSDSDGDGDNSLIVKDSYIDRLKNRLRLYRYLLKNQTQNVNIVTEATTDDNGQGDRGYGNSGEELIDHQSDEEPEYEQTPFNSTNACILGISDTYLSWWIKEDGTLTESAMNFNLNITYLDLSYSYRSASTIEERIARLREVYNNLEIRFLTIAHNNLPQIPERALAFLNTTLQFLSVTGNYFTGINPVESAGHTDNWSTFPLLYQLKELDIRNCSILYLSKDCFKNIPNLEKLFLSMNQFVFISDETFSYLPLLQHLDMSYNNYTIQLISPTTYKEDPYSVITEGLLLNSTTFKCLKELRFLDFSYTKIAPSSAKAFSFLGKKLQQLSLCNTGIQIIPYGMFLDTDIRILDISGNPSTSPFMAVDTFRGLENKLEILSYEYSNVKQLSWLEYLNSLVILKLKGNNINQLNKNIFQNLTKIELMDLSSNHISNWYNRVFEHNLELKILNVRDNNINIMSNEMFNDFAYLEFLSIGNNNFICNCLLRDFIDMAKENNLNINCSVRSFKNSKLINRTVDYELIGDDYNVIERVYQDYFSNVDVSYMNLQNNYQKINNKIYKIATQSKIYDDTYQSKKKEIVSSVRIKTSNIIVECNRTAIRRSPIMIDDNDNDKDDDDDLDPNENETIESDDDYDNPSKQDGEEHNSEIIYFTFQLMDFNENDYICINSTTNVEYQFSNIERCVTDHIRWDNDLVNIKNSANTIAIVLICLTVVLLFYMLCYYKWWYIRYFFILIKNATILTFLDKENDFIKKQKNSNNPDDGTTSEDGSQQSNFSYDVFVSYCDENRNWILNEFLPNIDDDEINVCLHERDFQVGLSILENIISCMDRSRVLLLIVSESFLLSQWCQFEMHLAQYRLLETRREQLILVLLEDISKRKRPKTLNYLMKIKTYIKWPTLAEKKIKNHYIIENIDPSLQPSNKLLLEERKLFWKRLKKALTSGRNETGFSIV